jgi:hypothetical protein
MPSALRPCRTPARRRGERGYILALLLGFCAVMGILLMKGIPAVNAEVQREMEEELIFRGEHLARAIRTYQAKTGGYPVALSDLNRIKPRLAREVDFIDPMNPKGEWDLVYAVQPGASGNTTGLPIVGVKSKVEENSFKIYRMKSLYSDWAFLATDSLFNLPGSAPSGGGRVGSPTDSSTTQDGGGKGSSGDPGGGSGRPPGK